MNSGKTDFESLSSFMVQSIERTGEKISALEVKYNKAELQRELLPLLRTSAPPDSWDIWVKKMVVELQSNLDAVLPFSEREMEFLDRLLTHGEMRPQLLTDQEGLIEKISRHPGLEWKALNVLRRQGCTA